MPFSGSCLCGQVRYSVSGDLGTRFICHCENCRKVTGSSFITSSFCDRESYTIVAGASILRTYRDNHTDSGATVERSFCGNCGSSVSTRNAEYFPDKIIIHAGTIDAIEDGKGWTPQIEAFCKRKSDWLTVEGTEEREAM